MSNLFDFEKQPRKRGGQLKVFLDEEGNLRKICKKCLAAKFLFEFYDDSRNRDGKMARCMDCIKETNKFHGRKIRKAERDYLKVL